MLTGATSKQEQNDSLNRMITDSRNGEGQEVKVSAADSTFSISSAYRRASAALLCYRMSPTG